MSNSKKIKSALISVFHKDGLDEIVKSLGKLGVKIYSTGGTQKFVESLGVPVTAVEDVLDEALLFRLLLYGGQKMLTSHALNQLCGKMGVPVRYVQKCIEQGMPDLAAENINAWLDEYHKSLFIRGYSDRARGVLSDKYATMDAPDVIEVLSDSFSDKKWAVRGLLVNEERLHIRVVQKKMLPP